MIIIMIIIDYYDYYDYYHAVGGRARLYRPLPAAAVYYSTLGPRLVDLMYEFLH